MNKGGEINLKINHEEKIYWTLFEILCGGLYDKEIAIIEVGLHLTFKDGKGYMLQEKAVREFGGYL